ncbi:MAG TPA: Holliday junction branch migration protein RuvA [Nitrospinaceae bacterium]|jgi:Holliday junction DNA helicase RuvA|nr:Holliday junction branch migration protein RuvA [Nitrospinaceae bacterium]
MIAHLKGKLTYKSPIAIIVDVNGIGYQVFVSLSTFYALPELKSEVFLDIYTHVREESLKLFGFYTIDEKKIFEKLISINKVGPKLALTILSGMSPIELFTTIDSNDVEKLSTIPGIGSKTAARLILEMRDKMGELTLDSEITNDSISQNVLFDDALSALVNLGYKKSQAEQALKKVCPEGEPEDSIEDLIKKSLNLLS